jgi:hypothetical protein
MRYHRKLECSKLNSTGVALHLSSLRSDIDRLVLKTAKFELSKNKGYSCLALRNTVC